MRVALHCLCCVGTPSRDLSYMLVPRRLENNREERNNRSRGRTLGLSSVRNKRTRNSNLPLNGRESFERQRSSHLLLTVQCFGHCKTSQFEREVLGLPPKGTKEDTTTKKKTVPRDTRSNDNTTHPGSLINCKESFGVISTPEISWNMPSWRDILTLVILRKMIGGSVLFIFHTS